MREGIGEIPIQFYIMHTQQKCEVKYGAQNKTILKLCQNKKGQMTVGMLVFLILFLNFNQLPADAKNEHPKNVWPFFFC